MAIKKLRKPLEINNDGTAIVGLGYDANGNSVVLLKGPSDDRAKSIQYNGVVPKIFIDELRDGSFLERKDDIKKLMKYRKEFQSSVGNSDSIVLTAENISPELENTEDNIEVAKCKKTTTSEEIGNCSNCSASLTADDLKAGKCSSCGATLTTTIEASVKSADDIRETIKNLTEKINQAVEYGTQDEVDRLETGLQKAFKELKEAKSKETEATITTAKSALLSFKEYDGLISGLMRTAQFDLKEGDLSKGKVILDWHSGSNVSIEFNIKPMWNENKLEITSAKLDVSGLENLNDSKVWKVIDRYLTDFEIPFERPANASIVAEVEEPLKTPDAEVEVKSAKILNRGKWNEAEAVEVDDSETEYKMLNKDFNFATIEDLIVSMLDIAETDGDYEEAIDFLSDISLTDSIVNYKDEIGFTVADISDFLDKTVSKWEKNRGYDASMNANITKVIANIID